MRHYPEAALVRLVVTLTAIPAHMSGLAEALRTLGNQARLEEGCLASWQCSTPDEAGGLQHYVEEWSSEDALRRSMRSLRFTRLLALMETADGPPTVAVDVVACRRGLDYIADARITESEAQEL
jgi:quinol monooxygenase YgiN